MIVAGVYLTSAVSMGKKKSEEKKRKKDKTAAVAASFLLCSLAKEVKNTCKNTI